MAVAFFSLLILSGFAVYVLSGAANETCRPDCEAPAIADYLIGVGVVGLVVALVWGLTNRRD